MIYNICQRIFRLLCQNNADLHNQELCIENLVPVPELVLLLVLLLVLVVESYQKLEKYHKICSTYQDIFGWRYRSNRLYDNQV
jgi:hypothetical protein